MIQIIGEDYKDCPKTPSGYPIPQITQLRVTGYKREPLWFHKRNLMQTATGYGRKLKTEHMIRIDKRWYRVFCCQFSNSGTIYIYKGGKNLVVDIDLVIETFTKKGN